MPCEHDERQEVVSCSVIAKLNSSSNNCIEVSIVDLVMCLKRFGHFLKYLFLSQISTTSLDQKWKIDWNVDNSAKEGTCKLSLTVKTKYHIHEKYGNSPKSTQQIGKNTFLIMFLTICTVPTFFKRYVLVTGFLSKSFHRAFTLDVCFFHPLSSCHALHGMASSEQ